MLYSSFESSNFFWENLEKTALTLGELAEVYLYTAPSFQEEAVSVSGSTVCLSVLLRRYRHQARCFEEPRIEPDIAEQLFRIYNAGAFVMGRLLH
jgi:hypothetical protein